MKTPCQDDPELWVSDDVTLRRQAVPLCAGCPIAAECLAGALERRETHGVWGGKDLTATKWGRAPKAERPTHCGNPDCGKPLVQNRNARPRLFCDDRCTYQASRPINHGTDGGYRAHKRRGIEPCQPCLKAHRLADVQRAERRRRAAA